MMDFDIKRLIPRFVYNDKNGHALAKALEAGLRYFLDVCQLGLDVWSNVDAMPEWRLDELAWEYNIPYDYTADVEVKRGWIHNVYALSKLYGTPEGMVQYMAPFFNGAAIQEPWDYGGDPYHFRMVFPDDWSPERIAWATTAIHSVKNVRSVLDGYVFKGEDLRRELFEGLAIAGHEHGRFAVAAVQIEGTVYTDENGSIAMDENGVIMMMEE